MAVCWNQRHTSALQLRWWSHESSMVLLLPGVTFFYTEKLWLTSMQCGSLVVKASRHKYSISLAMASSAFVGMTNIAFSSYSKEAYSDSFCAILFSSEAVFQSFNETNDFRIHPNHLQLLRKPTQCVVHTLFHPTHETGNWHRWYFICALTPQIPPASI